MLTARRLFLNNTKKLLNPCRSPKEDDPDDRSRSEYVWKPSEEDIARQKEIEKNKKRIEQTEINFCKAGHLLYKTYVQK